jgi:hypothetical protein
MVILSKMKLFRLLEVNLQRIPKKPLPVEIGKFAEARQLK